MSFHKAQRRCNIKRRFLPFFFTILFFLFSNSHHLTPTSAFTLSDNEPIEETKTLDLLQISEMRVRDIKRRLVRTHGYSNTELAKMLDKKELIHTLSYEEHKVYQNIQEKKKRQSIKRGIITALICVCVVLFWPLVVQVWEVGSVNFVVYTDKKKYEISRCNELSSKKGYIGILLLFLLDMLQLWLTTSVLLSWFISKNKYFFPIPSLSIRPAALLAASTGGNAGPLGQYGINIGSMLVTWTLRYVKSKVEDWMGKVLNKAMRAQRKAQREWESNEEKEERKKAKALRKEERRKRREEEALKERQQKVEDAKQRSASSVVTNSTTAKEGEGEEKDGGDEKKEETERTTDDDNVTNGEFYSQGEVPSWLNDGTKEEEQQSQQSQPYGDSGFDELD